MTINFKGATIKGGFSGGDYTGNVINTTIIQSHSGNGDNVNHVINQDEPKVVKVKYPDGHIEFLGIIPKDATIIIENEE